MATIPHVTTSSDLGHALAANDTRGIVAILGGMIRARDRLGTRWDGMARILFGLGEIDLGLAAIDLGIAQVGAAQRPALILTKAVLQAEHGQADRAATTIAALVTGRSTTLQVAHFLGVIQSQLGDFDAARRYFRAALAGDPTSGATWHGLAEITDFADDRAWAERLIAAGAAVRGTAPANQASYFYALAKAHDDLGAPDAAFAALVSATRAMATTGRYDAEGDRRDAQAVLDASFAPLPDAEDTAPPVIVLGFPRSGTTLVEQLLSRHPAMGGGDEVNVLKHVAARVGGGGSADLTAYLAAQADRAGEVRALRDYYRHLLDQRLGAGGRHTDKSLGNTRLLGLAASLFPSMPVVWLRRDPLDTAWSNYRTYFPRGMEWSLDQTSLARHMKLEDALHAHWSNVLGDRLLTVEHADLVADHAGVSAAILAHCGLDPSVQPAAGQAQSAVATASFAKVRREVSVSAVGTAAAYRRHLQPFVDAYGYAG